MPPPPQIVLITGASSGIGKAIGLRLARAGHIVFGTSRQPQLGDGHGPFDLLPMDVTVDASVSDAVAEVVKRAGRIDVLINNAGLGIQGPVEDIPTELALRLLDTNVLGPHRVCRAVVPHMRDQGRGLIVNISSVAANFGLPYRSFYSASKAALERYSEALSTEVARFGITVVTIQPGEFNTSIAGSRLRPGSISEANRPGYEKAMEVLGASMHTSRDPDELARVVEKVIMTDAPKTRYIVAQGMQRISILLKNLLPGRLFLRMVRRHYE